MSKNGSRRNRKKDSSAPSTGKQTNTPKRISANSEVISTLNKLNNSNDVIVRRLSQPLIAKNGSYHCVLNASRRLKRSPYSLLDKEESFKILRLKPFESFTDEHQRTFSGINEYVSSIILSYDRLYLRSMVNLEHKIQKVEDDWIQKYGSIPSISKSLKNKAEQYENIQIQMTRMNLDIIDMYDNESSDIMTPVEYKRYKKLLDQNKKFKSFKKQVMINHQPKVIPRPGEPGFEYLTSTIQTISKNNAILFSVDLEAFESDNNIITEIGISIYDPRENTGNFYPITRNYHLIISESFHIRNKKWVGDYKNCYIIGESFVMSLMECATFVQSLINYYMIPRTPEDETWDRAYVGHNIAGDLKWLNHIGVKVNGIQPSKDENQKNGRKNHRKSKVLHLDTEKLYKCCYGEDGASLGKILRLFSIPHAFLHNAGNDAYYTLQLLMKMGNYHFRKHAGLDNLSKLQLRIEKWKERDKTESKVLPSSYIHSVAAGLSKLDVSEQGSNLAFLNTKGDRLVKQTEFGGMVWYGSSEEALIELFDRI